MKNINTDLWHAWDAETYSSPKASVKHEFCKVQHEHLINSKYVFCKGVII